MISMRNRKKIQGYEIDLVNFDEAIKISKSAIQNGENLHVVTINPEMIELAGKNAEFANTLKNAELVIPDGVGIKLALKFKGINQEQIRGVDFSYKLIELCAENNYKLALLGAKEEVIQIVKEKLLCEFKNLNIVFLQNGYFKNEDEVAKNLINTQPQVILVALGAPRQELIISKLKAKLNGAVLVGVGGSFDVFSGTVLMAPVIWQKLGLEWLYRTMKQPERFKRIFPTLPIFLFKSIIEGIREKIFRK